MAASETDDSNESDSGSTDRCRDDCLYRRMVFWLLVTAQFVIAACMVLFLRSAYSHLATGAMAGLGIAFGIWAIYTMGRKTISASPALRSGALLVVRGPYRLVRHPMYLSLLVFCGAYAIRDFSSMGLVLWLALVMVLGIKMAYEEPMLRRRFKGYDAYSQKVKRLVPFIF